MTFRMFTALSGGAMLAAVGLSPAFADDAKEIALFLKAPVDIAAAITTAEAEAGGKAVAAGFDDDGPAGRYDVDLVKEGRKLEVEVDAGTGKLIKMEDDGSLDGDDARPEDMPATLGALTATAAAGGKGKVFAIEYDTDDRRPSRIEVDLVTEDGALTEYVLDAVAGTLTERRIR